MAKIWFVIFKPITETYSYLNGSFFICGLFYTSIHITEKINTIIQIILF